MRAPVVIVAFLLYSGDHVRRSICHEHYSLGPKGYLYCIFAAYGECGSSGSISAICLELSVCRSQSAVVEEYIYVKSLHRTLCIGSCDRGLRLHPSYAETQLCSFRGRPRDLFVTCGCRKCSCRKDYSNNSHKCCLSLIIVLSVESVSCDQCGYFRVQVPSAYKRPVAGTGVHIALNSLLDSPGAAVYDCKHVIGLA